MTWIRWTCLVLVGGCCHLGGHDAEEEDVESTPSGCVELEPSHEGHDEHQDAEEHPCDGGTDP